MSYRMEIFRSQTGFYQTELFAPSSRERVKRRQELNARSMRMRGDTKSWKTRRRIKWRVLADFSVSPS